MDMSSNFRPELHIAHQSRRDKLRNQHELAIYDNNLEHDGLNYGSTVLRNCRPGNICYDPSEFCPDMLNFSTNPQGILADQEPEKRVEEGSFRNFSRDMSSDPQNFGTWKSIGSQSTTDWVTNHTPFFVGEGLSGSFLKIMNSTNPVSTLDVKPYSCNYQELHLPNNCGSSIYQNGLQDFGIEMSSLKEKSSEEASHEPWVAYADQLRLKSSFDFISRPAEGCDNQWSNELEADREVRTMANDNAVKQALSLSLSSVPSPKVHETQKDFQCTNVQDSRNWNPNMSTGCRVGMQALTHRNPGPLGPFTGYATILRNSKFLRPTQQLLDEQCCIARSKDVEICEVSDKVFEEIRVSNGEVVAKGVAGDSSLLPFAFDGSSDKIREPGGMSCSTDSYRPDNLKKKAKLLYMQDEVCKRYKQYHQQMQMVVSSFESVAGLSAATPYVSLALKTVSKHFRGLKNAITDQLKLLRNALGEELSSPSGGTSSCKGDPSVSMLKFFDQNFQKQKGGSNLGILEGQHIWRPQRGLPERAVSILRAWLFDHFLHPYPTDTDKHMLASQTGLTRNQVSNWFINARVRVWKPMVEEIHMLETKGVAKAGSDAAKTIDDGCDQGNQVECSIISTSQHESNANIWNNQEKRSRIEYQFPSSDDGSLMRLVPSGVEMGGLGSVSLTLGLRQSAENVQRQPLQQEHHIRPHFGGQIIRDFVG